MSLIEEVFEIGHWKDKKQKFFYLDDNLSIVADYQEDGTWYVRVGLGPEERLQKFVEAVKKYVFQKHYMEFGRRNFDDGR